MRAAVDLQPTRVRYVRACVADAITLLRQAQRADDGDLAALVIGALFELRAAETELCAGQVAP